MENDFTYSDAKVTRWFTGSNIIERMLVMKGPSAGEENFQELPSVDGNPGRPVGSADLFMNASDMVAWLALCSGPALKREGRKVPPPSAIWKQSFPGDFEDRTVCFEDSLGLPKTIESFTKQGQTVFRYQTRGSTNVLGWNFPLEFYLVQYERRRPRTNSFEVEMTAKGRITAIAPCTEPRWPGRNRSAPTK